MKADRVAALLAAVSLGMPVAAACSGLSVIRAPQVTPSYTARIPPAPAVIKPGKVLLGVASASVAQWNRDTGTHAALSVAYVSMARPVAPAFMRWVRLTAGTSKPVIEILPRRRTLTAIAAGADDRWLRSLRREITSPVVISFAPEANGTWYSWGAQPAMFRAAWRHVRQILGTRHITWMWQVSAAPVGVPSTRRGYSGRLASYWPGRRYVNWVGLDGYFEFPANTFAGLFGHALSNVRAFTRAPVLLSETSIGPGTGRHQFRDLRAIFTALRYHQFLGMIWFDKAQHQPPFHQDWNLQDRPALLAEFRQLAAAPPGM